jgi:hypothetical protein
MPLDFGFIDEVVSLIGIIECIFDAKVFGDKNKYITDGKLNTQLM